MKFTLKVLSSKYEDKYDSFVRRNSNFLWYVSLSFKKLFTRYLRAEPLYFIILMKKKIVACLPFFICDNSNYGPILNSLPYYGSNGSFLLDNDLSDDEKTKIIKILNKKVLDYAVQNKISAITIITSPFDDFSSEYIENTFPFTHKDYRIGQLTPLPEDIDDLLSIFKNPRPRNIRKAKKSNIMVRKGGTKEDFKFLADIHIQNMNSIGAIAKESLFFDFVQNSKMN